MEKDIIAAVIFASIGFMMIYSALKLLGKYEEMETKGTKTKAKIIDFVAKIERNNQDRSNTTYYFPIVEFFDVEGNKVVRKLGFSEEPDRINTYISILYLKNGNEYDVLVDKKLWKSIFPQIFIYVGYLLIGVSIVLIVRKFRLDEYINKLI